jgi:hypothetical protein
VFTAPGAKHRDARQGLRVRERSWRFSEDGTVRFTRLDMFTTFDMRDELIENQMTQIPAPDVEPQQLFVRRDNVIRKEEALFSSLITSLDKTLPDPGQPLDVGPVYLDLGWQRLAPGLLFSAPSEPHAFAVYNTDTRALSSQIYTLLGPRKLEGVGGDVYAFEIREGLIDRPVLLYADRHGTMVRLVAGDLVLMRTTRESCEARYGARRDAACKRFNLNSE